MKDYLIKIINEKLTYSEDNKNKIKNRFNMCLSDYAALISGLNCGIILFGSSFYPNVVLNILVFLCLLFYISYGGYLVKKYFNGLKVKEKLNLNSINIEDLNDFYFTLMKEETLSKKEIEIFMSKIKDFNLQEGEVDYCIKKTMSEEKDLDIGNLLFMFKLYENIENYNLTKNNPVLIKKTKIQIMKNDNKTNEIIREDIIKEREIA